LHPSTYYLAVEICCDHHPLVDGPYVLALVPLVANRQLVVFHDASVLLLQVANLLSKSKER